MTNRQCATLPVGATGQEAAGAVNRQTRVHRFSLQRDAQEGQLEVRHERARSVKAFMVERLKTSTDYNAGGYEVRELISLGKPSPSARSRQADSREIQP